jgi:hypothetical protein
MSTFVAHIVILKEKRLTDLNESMTKSSNEQLEQKAEQISKLEIEIKKVRENLSYLESEKVNLLKQKETQVNELVKLLKY